MSTDVKLLPLSGSLRHWIYVSSADSDDAKDVTEFIEAYARANMEPLIAENERLRGEWLKSLGLSMQAQAEAKELRGACDVYQARAERLAKALRAICTGAPEEEPDDEDRHSDNNGDVASWASEWEHYRLATIARAALDQARGKGGAGK